MSVFYLYRLLLSVRFGLLSGHLLGNSFSSVDHLLAVCGFSYFPFWISGVWVLMAPVPGHCLLVNFRNFNIGSTAAGVLVDNLLYRLQVSQILIKNNNLHLKSDLFE